MQIVSDKCGSCEAKAAVLAVMNEGQQTQHQQGNNLDLSKRTYERATLKVICGNRTGECIEQNKPCVCMMHSDAQILSWHDASVATCWTHYLQGWRSCLGQANNMVVLQLGSNDVTSTHAGKGWLAGVQLIQHDAK